MRTNLKAIVCTTAFFICAALVSAQEQKPSEGNPSPQANAPSQSPPEKTDPQKPEPQTTEPQPAAPNPAENPAGKDQGASPQQESPPSVQVPPAPQEQAPAAKSKPGQKGTAVPPKTKGKKTGVASTHHSTKPHKSAAAQSGKVVVRNGGAKDESIQLSPAPSQDQSHNRENVDRLLASTDDNLKRVGAQQLTASQQSTLDQIHTYVRQAKSAVDAGDFSRAQTLALKAHLLSDDLIRR